MGDPVDLSKLLPVPPDVAERALIAAELENGLRCHSCSERIAYGWHIYLLSAVHDGDAVKVERRRIAMCDRGGCDEARLRAIGESTFWTVVEYHWPVAGVDFEAPPVG